MNPRLDLLHPYPFEKLRALLDGVTPPAALKPISWSIGEPKHPAPPFVLETVRQHLDELGLYPPINGIVELREAIAAWASRRFDLPAGSLTAERHVLPVAGTREALFSFAQAVIDSERPNPLVLMPNPCYQIYEGATLLAGATPRYLASSSATGGLPDLDQVDAASWNRCQLFYLCSPDNPTGAVASLDYLCHLITLAERHDFVIAADECYSELYFDEAAPPPGILQAAARLGLTDYARVIAFHSLSKRSNLAGLRSGFVAGDARLIERYRLYRTYHGAALPVPVQRASIAAWQDEAHVVENRARYRQKFAAVLDILRGSLDVVRPGGGFYLWPRVPLDDQQFTRELYRQQKLTVVPGSFLSRDVNGDNPGACHVRLALVAELDECIEGAERLRRFVEGLG
ncbi:MAG TPA: succinyldiaminopimelate transaminase [Pseudomonadales bacterium]|nr:succinyldiaminopimelate transaminase [Pseudomonadales bacterium]HNI64641.1 succinyldiaminopimelate transaminase [Pseudomonadales bacterium]